MLRPLHKTQGIATGHRRGVGTVPRGCRGGVFGRGMTFCSFLLWYFYVIPGLTQNPDWMPHMLQEIVFRALPDRLIPKKIRAIVWKKAPQMRTLSSDSKPDLFRNSGDASGSAFLRLGHNVPAKKSM